MKVWDEVRTSRNKIMKVRSHLLPVLGLILFRASRSWHEHTHSEAWQSVFGQYLLTTDWDRAPEDWEGYTRLLQTRDHWHEAGTSQTDLNLQHSSPQQQGWTFWRELWREIWWWPTVLWTSQLTADSNTNHYHHWSIFLSIKIQFSSQWFPKNQLNKRLSAHCTLWVKFNKVGKLLVANICVFDSTICNILSTLIK